MFEGRTKKERTIIYAGIAAVVTLILAAMHYYLMLLPIGLVMMMGAVEYVCVFYILYLPLKYQKE